MALFVSQVVFRHLMNEMRNTGMCRVVESAAPIFVPSSRSL